MANSVYRINKGIGKPIEFKGFKAQYIGYLGIGLVVLLIGFAILYLIGVNTYICLVTVAGSATTLVVRVRSLSSKYGEHGMMKKAACRVLPHVLVSRSRNIPGFRIIKVNKQQST